MRFKNEVEAMPKIKQMFSKTKRKLCVLSKVGTSIFFSFPEYVKLLEDDPPIQVLMVDPDDKTLIGLMDKIYVHQTKVKNRWKKMLSQMTTKLEELHDENLIPDGPHKNIKTLLDNEANEKNIGYRNIIIASIMMWNLAKKQAENVQISSQT